ASISSSTSWGFNGGGNAGEVNGTVGSLNVESGGEIRSRAGLLDGSGQVLSVGEGNAGSLNFSADNITISGGSMSTTTIGDGKGGDVVLNATQNVNITNGGSVSADSLAMAATDATGGVGGDTGSINITAGNSITLDGGTISTRAVAADGGNISLFAPNIVYLNNSQITTSVESGIGGGGNVLIDPQFVILNNSSIIANAYGGPGGNITIVASNYLSSATSIVQASSALSTPGTIRIVSPENNIESTIAQLASEFLDASSLLRGLCSARRTGAASSFTVANRGGVPVEADGYLPSFSMGAANGSASAGAPVRANALDVGGERVALALVMPDTLDCTR
ncbi:MAG: hypothetical protein LJE90_06350, partial [Betaproteobacteria bacterium]|nr:hypothetical protein [Betaproteobacteria bacterium]